MAESKKLKVILDTDPGSDIDDAIALAYLLSLENSVELIGATTVTGDVKKRAAILDVVAQAAGKSMSVHLGSERVLLEGPGQPHVPHHEAVAHLDPKVEREPHQAVDFLRTQIKQHPGDITLLSIGPLTNVAELLIADPTITHQLAGVVSMLGAFDREDAEWNAKVDPLATAIVCDRLAKTAWTILPLDVTTQCTLGPDEVRNRFRSPMLQSILPMCEVWLSHTKQVTFHDPLAVAALLQPEWIQYEVGTVSADRLTGKTHLRPHPDGPHRVAKGVQPDRFFEHFFSSTLHE